MGDSSRQHVLCREVGHTFGLDHNREGAGGGSPDDTCMNDQTRPLNFRTPNLHDDQVLTGMYGHDHGATDGGGGPQKCHSVRSCAGAAAVPVTRVILRVTDTMSGQSRPAIVLEQTRGPGLEIVDDPGYVQGDSYPLYPREIDDNTYRTVNPDARVRR